MKKLIAAVCLTLALPASAIPPTSATMIRELIANETSLATLLDGLMGDGDSFAEPAFESITIERVSFTPELRRRCSNNSRSGAALKVTLSTDESQKNYIFSTSGGARVGLCK